MSCHWSLWIVPWGFQLVPVRVWWVEHQDSEVCQEGHGRSGFHLDPCWSSYLDCYCMTRLLQNPPSFSIYDLWLTDLWINRHGFTTPQGNYPIICLLSLHFTILFSLVGWIFPHLPQVHSPYSSLSPICGRCARLASCAWQLFVSALFLL